ncbi:partial putative GTPase, partial [Candidatus Brocadiaceae bacterium]
AAILQGINEGCVLAATILGITGPPGAGKSTLINQLISHYRIHGKRVGIVAIDPSSPVSGGAILGDRIRMMRHATDPGVLIRSMSTRGRVGGLCAAAGSAAKIMACSGCNPVIIETVGVGHLEIDIVGLADIVVFVLAPGFGDDVQAMKAGLIEMADVLVVNKADHAGADALIVDLKYATQGRDCQVCSTSATESRGIEDLANIIGNIAQRKRQTGQFIQKREKMLESEILHRAVELMRTKLKDRLMAQEEQIIGDPQDIVRKLLEEVCVTQLESKKR